MDPQRRGLTLTLILIVGLLTVAPVAMLLLGSFSQGLDAFGHFTLAKYASAYSDPGLWKVLFNTAVFVVGSTLLATLLALFLAYLNTRTDIPFKFLFNVLAIVPMMIPHVLFSVSWALLANPSNGLMNLALMETFGLAKGPLNIYSMPGMILVEGLLNMPIAYLIIAPAMASFDVSLEESSRVFGAGAWRTLLRITLPVLRPAILAAFVLGIVRSLASYAVPRVLGMPGNEEVLATYLYEMISVGFAPDYGKAAALGMSVLLVAVVLIWLYRRLTGEGSRFVTISSRGWRPAVVPLGRWRMPLFALVALLSFIVIVLPVVVLLYTSFVPYAMVPSRAAFAAMSFKHWAEVLGDATSLLALKNSLFLAIVGATLGVLLSLFVAYVIVKLRTRRGAAGDADLSVVRVSGHRDRHRLHVVLRADTAVRHGHRTADRLHRHLSALWCAAPGERFCAGARPPGRIVAGMRRQPHDDDAAHYRAAVGAGHCVGVDSDGHHVSA